MKYHVRRNLFVSRCGVTLKVALYSREDVLMLYHLFDEQCFEGRKKYENQYRINHCHLRKITNVTVINKW